MNIDQIINRKHQQLNQIKTRLFETVLARNVELYTPDTVNDTYVLQDEDDFEEAEVVGLLKTERLPLNYIHQGTVKMIEVWPNSSGRFAVVGTERIYESEQLTTFRFKEQGTKKRFGLVRDNESNEFEPNRAYYFLSLNTGIPMQSVIQYQVVTNVDETASQQIQLVKIDERSIGKPIFVNQVHTFTPFHGDVV